MLFAPADSLAPTYFASARARCAPLSALAGGGLARRFHSWFGRSGRRYVCSVFSVHDHAAMETLSGYSEALVLTVRSDAQGQSALLSLDETGSIPELFWNSERLAGLRQSGASEIHVHLMAETAEARRAVTADILAQFGH